MMLIADRRDDGCQAEAGTKKIKAAYEVACEGPDGQLAAYFQGQLRETQVIRDRVKGR